MAALTLADLDLGSGTVHFPISKTMAAHRAVDLEISAVNALAGAR